MPRKVSGADLRASDDFTCTVQLGLDNVLFMAESEETCRTYTKALNNSGAQPYLNI